MRYAAYFLPLAILAACGSTPSGDGGSSTDTSTSTEPNLPEPPTVDTSFPPADEGSVMLSRKLERNGTWTVELFGLFVDEHAGYHNLAQCAATGEPCIDYLPPAEDDLVDFDLERVFEPEFSEYRYAGLEIGFGPYLAPYLNDTVPRYYADLTAELGTEDIRGDFGVTYSGQWGDYAGTDDVYVSPNIDLITPAPNSNIEFHDNDTILVEWVPDGRGTVLLKVIETGINASVAKMYWLEDDGYFEVPTSDFGFSTDDTEVTFRLSRWNSGWVNRRGNALEVMATSEVSWTGEYFYVGGREELILEDKCLPATTMPPLESGSYWGQLADDGYRNDMSDVSACIGVDAPGEEGFGRIELQPLEFLTATLNLPTADASIYLVTDCTRANTCLTGSDLDAVGIPESLNYFNETDEVVTLYLGVDAFEDATGIFNLDVSINPLVEPEMYNTCPEAMTQATATGEGTYFTSYLPYTPTLDPGVGGCTGSALTGPDSMTLVTLQAGETLTANINMANADPALYLLYNCTNPVGCPAGADVSVGASETLIYTNGTAFSENLYLVVDTRGASLQPYFLTVDISP